MTGNIGIRHLTDSLSKSWPWGALCFAVLMTFHGAVAVADESENGEKKAASGEEEEAPSLMVERETFLPTVSTTGVFVSTETTEVKIEPEEWSTLKVVKVAPHGSTVMEGDTILTLETEDLDEAIEKAETSLESSRIALKLASDELRFMKESTAMDLEEVERNAKQAKEDLEYYLDVQHEQNLESAEWNLKFARYRLEYAQEELDQLQQMYEADDLTEQTEEIVLLRAKRDVEQAERAFELSQQRYDRQIETLIPREKQQMIDNQAEAALTKAKTVATLPLTVQQKERSVEQMKRDHEEAEEKLQNLKADRNLMTVQAPQSGIVYYGKATLGKWSEVSARAKQLTPGGSAPANTVLMTIADPDQMEVLADIKEEQLSEIEDGQLALVRPKSELTDKLFAEVANVRSVTAVDGNYKATLRLQREELEEGLVPGMTCDIKIRVKPETAAILLPEAYVQEDEFRQENGTYVWLDGEEVVKQPVSVGLTRDGKVEIVQGLEEGDTVLKDAPKEDPIPASDD